MRLVKMDEKVDFEDTGSRVVLKLLSGSLEDDDFDDVVTAIDLLFDMMVSSRFKTKFDVGAFRSKIETVRKRFDGIVDDIKKNQKKTVI